MKTTFFILFAILGLLPLAAEDLTTLDGRTFTNISQIDKYSKLIVFTYNGTRKAMAITNLSTDFCARHGIAVPVPPAVESTSSTSPQQSQSPEPQLSPLDAFLWQNRKSDLERSTNFSRTMRDNYITKKKFWTLTVRSGELEFLSDTTTYLDGDKNPIDLRYSLAVDVGYEGPITNGFNKFFEWEGIAQTNKAENFEKEMGHWIMNPTGENPVSYVLARQCKFTFRWSYEKATLETEGADGRNGTFDRDDVEEFRMFAGMIPDLKQQLADALRNKEAQKDLFK